ncbi:MAG: hypothetical protein ACSHYF_01395 [Verrucomicrobiaceae bacterium]
MKYLKLVVVPLVLYMVGLMLGPMLGSMVVKEAKEDTSLKQDVKISDAVFHVNLAELRDSELPKMVKTKVRLKLPTVSGEGFKDIAEGREVKLLNRNDKKLIIETKDGLARGEVDIDQTNIFETIGLAMMADLRAKAAGGSQAPGPTPQPTPSPQPAPTPQPTPPVVADNGGNEPAPNPGMTPEPKPDPIPEPTPEPSNASLNPEQIVEVMKKSIADGAVKEFTLKQVEAWQAGDEEDFGGETFQTGLAAYKAETIFGVKTVQAKALIKGGKVSKWVYAKTGMEIR